MALLTTTLTDGRTIQFEDEPIAAGAEKVVFMARDRQSVVAFFFGRMSDRGERAERLTRILTTYNPTTGARGAWWASYFCWPTGVVDGDLRLPPVFAQAHHLVWPPLAIVAPTYRASFFFRDRLGNRQEKEVKWFTGRKAGALVPEEERGTLLTRLQICTRLARAVRRMHFAGLAHSDLSNKNVLIDPKGGDACVIDIDSLVVPGVAPPTVLGTPGYIAPEVLMGKAQPGIATDRHALAVLIYQILLGRHPLQGRRVHSMRSAEEDEVLSMGAKALFVEHPGDRSNAPREAISVPMQRLGPFLAELFVKAFVHGLHHPAQRPDAAEWELALYRTFNLLHPTPSGRDWFVLGPGMPLATPASVERVPGPVPLVRFLRDAECGAIDEGMTLTVYHNLVLHRWHALPGTWPDEHADRTPIGYVSHHQGAWWLVNLASSPMQVEGGDEIPRQGLVRLAPGVRVRPMPGTSPRLWAFEEMR